MNANKNLQAARNTVTRDTHALDQQVNGNLFEAIVSSPSAATSWDRKSKRN